MAGTNLRFDGCDLAPATSESRRYLLALLGDLVERAPVAFEDRLLTAQCLPPLDRYINVFRIKLYAPADTLGNLGSSQRCSRSEERVIHRLATLRMIQQRAPHQIDRLLGRMVLFLVSVLF